MHVCDMSIRPIGGKCKGRDSLAIESRPRVRLPVYLNMHMQISGIAVFAPAAMVGSFVDVVASIFAVVAVVVQALVAVAVAVVVQIFVVAVAVAAQTFVVAAVGSNRNQHKHCLTISALLVSISSFHSPGFKFK